MNQTYMTASQWMALPAERRATEERVREIFAKYGVRDLSESEYTVKNGFAMLHVRDPNGITLLCSPEEIAAGEMHGYLAGRVGNPLPIVGCSRYPIRMQEWAVSDSSVLRLWVDQDGNQTYSISDRPGSANTPCRITEAFPPVTEFISVPEGTRGLRPSARPSARAILNAARRARGCRPYEGLLPSNDAPVAQHRPRDIARRTLPSLIRDMKRLGEAIGRLGTDGASDVDVDSNEAAEILQSMRDCGMNISSAVDAWNERCCLGDDLTEAECGHVVRDRDTVETHDGDVCGDCFDDNYVFCQDTEDYRLQDHVYVHDDGDYYTYEEEDLDEDDEETAGGHVADYCSDVLRRLPKDNKIHSSPYGDFLMGIELETSPLIDTRVECAEDTDESLCPGYAIMKNDGSLDGDGEDYDNGIEIVTAPRGLAEHIRRFSEWTPYKHLRAWDSGCCGMHVHLDSRAFTPLVLGKFIEFINDKNNDGMILEIAGRSPSHNGQAESYCQREGNVVRGNPKMTLDGKATNRYRMVNTKNLSYAEARRLGLNNHDSNGRNYNTVELRIFRATLSKPRLLAQIEFAHASVMFCRVTSMQHLTRADFVAWLRGTAGLYPHLAKWFGVAQNKKDVVEHPKVRETAEV